MNHSRKKERGQSLVEVALTLPILLLILSGLLDIGRVYYIYIALEEGAQEAATFLAQNPWCISPTDEPPADAALDNCDNPNNAEFRILNASQQEIELARLHEIEYEFPLDFDGDPVVGIGSTITVTIRYDFPLVTPLLRDIAGEDGLTLTARASHLIIQE